MDLQAVIDECLEHPERYETSRWWVADKPRCPLAKLVLRYKTPQDPWERSAIALGISEDTVHLFTIWWDTKTKSSIESLKRLGYRFDKREVMKDG